VEGGDVVNNASVTVRDVQLRRGPRTILAGMSFSVASGEIVALMGQSGSGKTTMLRTIAALEAFDAGVIEIGEVTLSAGGAAGSRTIQQLRRKVGMVFQFHCLFDHLTALENVTLAPVLARGVLQANAEQRALELLGTLGVAHRARALPRELSGGEAQRVAIARALAMDPEVLLMDEPTASLDPARRSELATLLRELVGRERTLLIATHDEDFAGSVATRVLHLTDGAVQVGA
jgi:ABC-type polar amino acid transport system ATPase subunit